MKIIFTLLIFLSCLSIFASPKGIEGETLEVLRLLSSQYRTDKEIVFKKNIAVAEFEYNSEDQEIAELASALGDLLSVQISASTIFSLVERRKMNEILEEQKLQLSGLTSEKDVVEIGEIMNVHAVLFGSITELGDNFQISIKLVDVETGQSYAEKISAKKEELIATKEAMLDMAYVQKMGVGISLISGGYNAIGNNPANSPVFDMSKTGLVRVFGLEVKYRFSKNFMVGIGANSVYAQLKYYDSVTVDYDNTFLSALPGGPSGTSSPLPFTISGEGNSITANLYFVKNPMRRLNLFASAGLEMLELRCHGRFEPSNGTGFGTNEYGPEIYAETVMFNTSGGFEYFFTPRLAFSFKAGYSFGSLSLDTNAAMGHLVDFEDEGKDTVDISLNSYMYEPSFSVYF